MCLSEITDQTTEKTVYSGTALSHLRKSRGLRIWHLSKGKEAVLCSALMRLIMANGHHGLLETGLAVTERYEFPATVQLDLQGQKSSGQLSTEKTQFWH